MGVSHDYTKIWFHSIVEILTQPFYAVLAIGTTYLLLLIASWLPNTRLLTYILNSDSFSLADKLQFLLDLKGLAISATTLSFSLLMVTAILTGVNISLITYYLKTRATLERAAGVTVIGIVGSFVGVGCASCGSVILTSIIGFAASATFIGVLPFRGLEFAVGGLLLVGFSTYIIARKITKPLVC